MSESFLQVILWVTGSVCALFIRFGRRILIHTLKSDQLSAVRMPSVAEITTFKQAFEKRHRVLKHVYSIADGLKLRLEQSGDVIVQNRYYNGWTHDHYVSNVMVFAPNGRIIACALNAPV